MSPATMQMPVRTVDATAAGTSPSPTIAPALGERSAASVSTPTYSAVAWPRV